MSDEATKKGGGSEDTRPEEAGANGHAGGAETGGNSAGGVVLEEAAEGGGVQNRQDEAAGTQSNGAVGDSNWGFATIWNRALEEGEQRAYEPRERIFATELGKAPIDVYLAMKGVEPTNLPNARSKRKFEAGNMWEWIVGLVLKRAGIIQSSQERVEMQMPGMCPVSGRLDFIAGGMPDFEKAKAEIRSFDLPEMFYKGFEKIVEHLQTKFPEGLKERPFEIKSLSVFMYDAIEKTGKALGAHRKQLIHYMKSKGYKVGTIVYICRDDCRMMEIPVVLNDAAEKEYADAVAERSGYYLRDEMPPLEKGIVWDKDMLKFSKNNMGMAYSMYLTKLYKFKDQAEFDAKYQPMQLSFNRVLKRVATGAKMTAKNEEVLAQMREEGFDPEVYAKLIPLDAPEEEEVTAE